MFLSQLLLITRAFLQGYHNLLSFCTLRARALHIAGAIIPHIADALLILKSYKRSSLALLYSPLRSLISLLCSRVCSLFTHLFHCFSELSYYQERHLKLDNNVVCSSSDDHSLVHISNTKSEHHYSLPLRLPYRSLSAIKSMLSCHNTKHHSAKNSHVYHSDAHHSKRCIRHHLLPQSILGKSFFLFAVLVLTLSACANLTMTALNLHLNVSSSLPYGLYQAHALSNGRGASSQSLPTNSSAYVSNSSIKRGSLVLACLPDTVAKLANERNYVARGKCTQDTAPVGKYVVGVTGDKLVISSDGVWLNGSKVPNSQAAITDAKGRTMPRIELGTLAQPYEIKAVEVFLLNFKADSFDGRYYGVVPLELIKAQLEPLFIR